MKEIYEQIYHKVQNQKPYDTVYFLSTLSEITKELHNTYKTLPKNESFAIISHITSRIVPLLVKKYTNIPLYMDDALLLSIELAHAVSQYIFPKSLQKVAKEALETYTEKILNHLGFDIPSAKTRLIGNDIVQKPANFTQAIERIVKKYEVQIDRDRLYSEMEMVL